MKKKKKKKKKTNKPVYKAIKEDCMVINQRVEL